MSKIITPAGQKIECQCNLITCYGCRRRAIDAKASMIYAREIRLCAGMDFDVEAHAARMAQDYRCKAINQLAFDFN